MTEDSGEVNPVGDKASVENKKRRLKTPSQVLALENFYNEHKYPSEEMKAKLAEEIGLTEKQVSGWFCHRRLKDKRALKDEGLTMGRQDRSSVVIQDHGSGLRQDSCGSTKQMDYKSVDPREVESQRPFEPRSRYIGNVDGIDSTSSESSSSLQDRQVSGKECLYDLETSRYLTQNGAITPLDHQVTRNTEYKPSGFLKVKGEVENAAITAVKRQLGRHYLEHGPPLGVEFDPLPPGAFESPTNGVVHEPIYVGGHRQSRSPDVSGVRKHSRPGRRYEAYDSKMHSSDPYFDKSMLGLSFADGKNHVESRQRSPSLSYNNPFPDRNSLLEMHKNSPRETAPLKSKRGKMSSKHGAEGTRYDSVFNQHAFYGGNHEINHASSQDHDSISSKLACKIEYPPKSSNEVLAHSKFPDLEERGPSIGKAGKYYGERDPAKVHRKKMHLTDEPIVAKRVRHNYSQQDYASKASHSETLGRKNHMKGSAMEVPSSFSEDETVETSSSVD